MFGFYRILSYSYKLTYKCTEDYIHLQVCTYVFICIICNCMYIHLRIYIYIFVEVSAYMYIYIYAHVYVCECEYFRGYPPPYSTLERDPGKP